MIYHRGWIYCLIFLIPLTALARPAKRMRVPGALASVLVPVDTTFLASDGVQYRLNGTLTLAPLAPPPPPPPPSLTISYVTDSPLRPVLGGTSTVTVVMTGTATAPVTMAVKIVDPAVTGPTSVTLPAGASQVSFDIRWVTAVTAERYASTIVTLGTVSKSANIILSPSTPPPPPPGAVNPTISAFLNADGSPARVLVYGQEVRILGQGFGTTPGKVVWIGAAVQIASWTDTEVRVKLPVPKPPGGGLQFLLIKPDGGYNETGLPGDLPPPVPGSRR